MACKTDQSQCMYYLFYFHAKEINLLHFSVYKTTLAVDGSQKLQFLWSVKEILAFKIE